jgi:hypothetical protein
MPGGETGTLHHDGTRGIVNERERPRHEREIRFRPLNPRQMMAGVIVTGWRSHDQVRVIQGNELGERDRERSDDHAAGILGLPDVINTDSRPSALDRSHRPPPLTAEQIKNQARE